MTAVLLTGLKAYYAATGDERVMEAIVKGARFLVGELWVPEARGFRYTSCPETRAGSGLTFLLFDGIVFAYQRTRDPKLAQVLELGTEPAVHAMNGWGKGFTMFTRVAPHYIGPLADLLEKRQRQRGRLSLFR